MLYFEAYTLHIYLYFSYSHICLYNTNFADSMLTLIIEVSGASTILSFLEQVCHDHRIFSLMCTQFLTSQCSYMRPHSFVVNHTLYYSLTVFNMSSCSPHMMLIVYAVFWSIHTAYMRLWLQCMNEYVLLSEVHNYILVLFLMLHLLVRGGGAPPKVVDRGALSPQYLGPKLVIYQVYKHPYACI